MPLSSDFSYAFVVDGVPAVARISPCSWMYPHHGLQVEVKINGGQVFFRSTTRFADASEDEAISLAMQAKHSPCVKCGEPAVVDGKSNRAGQCEKCFMTALNASFAAEQAKAQAKAAKREAKADEKAKKDGFNFKTVAWVHPSAGDDYQIAWYSTTAPTAAEAAQILRRRRSEVLTDYTTTAL